MLHIKLINEYFNSEYYQIANKNEFKDKFNQAKEMDEDSTKALNDFLQKVGNKIADCTYHRQGCQIIIDYKTNEKISVYPIDDYWFFCVYSLFTKQNDRIDVNAIYYKCDQIEGVIKLISDIISQ
jgi:hypothetical protein